MNKYIITGILFTSTLFSQSMIPANINLDLIRQQLQSESGILIEESVETTPVQENILIEQDDTVGEGSNPAYYGYEYFDRDINFFDNIPTPSNFKLGSGDEVILSLWGETNSREKFVINKAGLIYYKNIGFINLSNKTIEEAEQILVSKLSNIYSTLKEDNKSTDLMLELDKLKSLNIYFSGEIKIPGIHLIHPFSDIFSAIAQAGGVKLEGSLRNIKIMRDGNILQNIDFYDFFTTGNDNFSNVKLIEGDVIHIPAIKNRVHILGEVVRGGFYEMIDGEFLNDVITYSAGLTALASSHIIIETVTPIEQRHNNDSASSSMNIDFKNSKSTTLNNGDTIIVKSIGDVSSKVEIFGRVKQPGEYPVVGATLKDILDIAGGFNDSTYRKTIQEDYIVILRKDHLQFYSQEIISSYKNANQVELEVNDKILVYENINYRNSFTYSIEGEILKPGLYALHSSGITIRQALELAGGFTVLGSERNLAIQQEFTTIESDGNIVTELKIVNNVDLDFEIGTNSVITATPVENVVRVEGNVYNPGLITFRSGIRFPEYIELAGGYKPDTLKKKIYIKRSNGHIENVKRLYLVGKKMYAGDTIVVPVNPNPSDFNTAAFTADILSVLGNLVAILAIVDNNNP